MLPSLTGLITHLRCMYIYVSVCMHACMYSVCVYMYLYSTPKIPTVIKGTSIKSIFRKIIRFLRVCEYHYRQKVNFTLYLEPLLTTSHSISSHFLMCLGYHGSLQRRDTGRKEGQS